MRTYENHYLTEEMQKPFTESARKAMELELPPPVDVPDDFSAMKIAEIERLERMRQREEERPIEEPAPASVFTSVSED